MNYSIAMLLGNFVDDKLVAGKQLEKKLDITTDVEREELQIILTALERLGILVKERGKYKRLYPEDMIEAKLRCSSKGFCFAIQDDEDAVDVYIREGNLSHAWNGDRVLVKITKDGYRRKSPEGQVRLIINRANPSLLAQVKQKSAEEYCAVPLDDRLLFELSLQDDPTSLQTAIDHLVHVSVLRYPLAQSPPLGKVTKVLGSDAEAAADTDIVSCKHDFSLTWPESVVEAAQALPTTINPNELKRRLDLRKQKLFTVQLEPGKNPTPWQEVALSLETKAKHWQLGIHIADVAHYIPEGSLLAQSAQQRGNAVYLGSQTCALFPDAVAQRCSLTPESDRLALSFFLNIDHEGQVLEFNYQASVVKIKRQFTFNEVQALLANPDSPPKTVKAYGLKSYIETLQQLFFHLCPALKSQRLQRGGFNLQTEPLPVLGDEARLGTILETEHLPTQALLADVFVVLQHQVALQLQGWGIPAIYCGQSTPDWDELTDILRLAENLKLDAKANTEEDVTPQDYYHLTHSFQEQPAKGVLYRLLAGTLPAEKYFSHPAAHFALACDSAYCHCIAPGQRYADLVIQRLFKLVLSDGRDRRTKQMKTGVELTKHTCRGKINWNVLAPALHDSIQAELHQLVVHLNDRNQVATAAEQDLLGLQKAEAMKARTGEVFRGIITGVQSYGFFVQTFELLTEGLVHVSSLNNDWYEFRGRQASLIGRKSNLTYRLGDEVDVRVKNVDYFRQQVDLAAVDEGNSTPPSTPVEAPVINGRPSEKDADGMPPEAEAPKEDIEALTWDDDDDDDPEAGAVIF